MLDKAGSPGRIDQIAVRYLWGAKGTSMQRTVARDVIPMHANELVRDDFLAYYAEVYQENDRSFSSFYVEVLLWARRQGLREPTVKEFLIAWHGIEN